MNMFGCPGNDVKLDNTFVGDVAFGSPGIMFLDIGGNDIFIAPNDVFNWLLPLLVATLPLC